jgi:aminotransferase
MEPTGKLHASRKASSFTESVIRDMTRLAHLHDAINLGQGYPDFPAPVIVKEAAAKAIAEDHNQYPITWGVPAFRQAIAATYARDYGMAVDPETEICVTCGATEAMAATFLGVLIRATRWWSSSPSTRATDPTPFWPARRCDTTLRAPDWTFDPDELTSAFSSRTRAT